MAGGFTARPGHGIGSDGCGGRSCVPRSRPPYLLATTFTLAVLVAGGLGACGRSVSATAGTVGHGGGSASGPGRPMDPAAGLKVAVAAMQQAPDFTFAGSVTEGSSVTRLSGQFSAPDTEHLVLQPPHNPTTELLFVGGKAYVKTASGSWVNKLGGSTPPPSDPRSTFVVLDSATKVTSWAGTEGTTYSFSLPPTAATALFPGATTAGMAVTGSATVAGDHIVALRLSLTHGAGPAVVTELGYSMIGSTPPLPAPS